MIPPEPTREYLPNLIYDYIQLVVEASVTIPLPYKGIWLPLYATVWFISCTSLVLDQVGCSVNRILSWLTNADMHQQQHFQPSVTTTVNP